MAPLAQSMWACFADPVATVAPLGDATINGRANAPRAPTMTNAERRRSISNPLASMCDSPKSDDLCQRTQCWPASSASQQIPVPLPLLAGHAAIDHLQGKGGQFAADVDERGGVYGLYAVNTSRPKGVALVA